jgi:menaquinone-dependent protoporphyrinogen oxidase
MRILILYGTTEGQTRRICEKIASQLSSLGDTTTLMDASTITDPVLATTSGSNPGPLKPGPVNNAPLAPDVTAFDAAILAASVHAGEYQASIQQFARTNAAALNAMPTAFVSVSLSAASDDAAERTAIDECAGRFAKTTGWIPLETLHVAGAFRFTRYDFFKGWAMKLIAWEKKVTFEAGKDLELTNWGTLAESTDDLRAHFRDKPRR